MTMNAMKYKFLVLLLLAGWGSSSVWAASTKFRLLNASNEQVAYCESRSESGSADKTFRFDKQSPNVMLTATNASPAKGEQTTLTALTATDITNYTLNIEIRVVTSQ